MMEKLREIGHKAPIFSTIFKMMISATLAFMVFVSFIMPPIIVHDIYAKSDSVHPGDSYFLVTQTYKNPLTSFLCVEKDVSLHSKVAVGDLQLTLTVTPEPYGNKVPGKINEITIEHHVPINVKGGSILLVHKEYTYSCLGFTRKVQTPIVRIKIDSEPLAPRIDGSGLVPAPSLVQPGFGFQYEQRSLK